MMFEQVDIMPLIDYSDYQSLHDKFTQLEAEHSELLCNFWLVCCYGMEGSPLGREVHLLIKSLQDPRMRSLEDNRIALSNITRTKHPYISEASVSGAIISLCKKLNVPPF